MSAKKIAQWVLLFSFLHVLINECSETHHEITQKAAEMRYRALKNLSGKHKRQRKDEVENETAASSKHRRIGSDTVAYLSEKNDLM